MRSVAQSDCPNRLTHRVWSSKKAKSPINADTAWQNYCRVALGDCPPRALTDPEVLSKLREEFALRMQKGTGCVIADVGGSWLIDPSELVGLNGQWARVNPAARNR
jgi:hypothetical protein